MNYEILKSKFKDDETIKKIVSKEIGVNFFKNLNKFYTIEEIVNTFLDTDLICLILQNGCNTRIK